MPRLLMLLCCFTLIPGCQKARALQPTEFELDNGLTVILQPLPTATTNTLVVLFDIGNRFDPPGQSGMAHLAEHLYVTAATGKTASRNVDEYMAAYPDGWNAQTGDDYTVFATVFNPDRLSQELGEAADRMQSMKPNQADLDRELPRIELELDNMYEKVPLLAVSNHGRDRLSPLAADGRRGGKIDELRTVDVQTIHHWLDRYYKPGNAILILAGVFETETVRAEITSLFGSIDSGEKPTANGPDAGELKSGEFDVTIRPYQPNSPAQVGITIQAPDWNDPLYPEFLVHATRMMMASQRQGQSTTGPLFMWRTLDDPQFCYASGDVNDGESLEAAIVRLEKWLNEQTAVDLRPVHLKQTENMLGMFLGLKELPPAMLAFNPYGAAFSAGRRHQLGIDSGQLKTEFAKVDQASMNRACERFFTSSGRVTIKVVPADERP